MGLRLGLGKQVGAGHRQHGPKTAGLLARIIYDGSLRNRPGALRDGRVEPRWREAYSLQYVDRLSGEPARLHAADAACRLVAAANGRL